VVNQLNHFVDVVISAVFVDTMHVHITWTCKCVLSTQAQAAAIFLENFINSTMVITSVYQIIIINNY